MTVPVHNIVAAVQVHNILCSSSASVHLCSTLSYRREWKRKKDLDWMAIMTGASDSSLQWQPGL